MARVYIVTCSNFHEFPLWEAKYRLQVVLCPICETTGIASIRSN